jgi:cytidyltransferase-like protein
MNPMDKAVLSSIYSSNLDPQVCAFERIKQRFPIDLDLYESRVDRLKQTGFVEKDAPTRLTFIGRDALKVILVGGVFDLLHPGHIHTLKSAKDQGDVLVVVVARTSTALKIKKDRKIYHDQNLRKELVSSLSFVDLAIIGKEGTLYDTVEYVKPDVIALGYDQSHDEKEVFENCQKRNLNLRVIRLNTPLPETKSSKLKDELGDSFYRL